MKKLAIVLPIFTFTLFCVLALILGMVAGFFCVLGFSNDHRENSEPTSYVCVSDFINDKSKKVEKFPVQSFKREIAKILYDDFCKKAVSVGEVQPAPDFELNGNFLRVSIGVNSPILFFNVERTLSFDFDVAKGFILCNAHISDAKIPLVIARIILNRTLKKYLEVKEIRELANAFFNCKMEVENGFLVLKK